MARAAEQLGDAGVSLEGRLDAAAGRWDVDPRDVLDPLAAPLSVA